VAAVSTRPAVTNPADLGGVVIHQGIYVGAFLVPVYYPAGVSHRRGGLVFQTLAINSAVQRDSHRRRPRGGIADVAAI
jgi:hypothetical protein